MLPMGVPMAGHNIPDRVSFYPDWRVACPDCRSSSNRPMPCCCLGDSIVGFEIDLLIFQTAPEALDKYIVHPASLAIHADAESHAP